MYIIYICLKDQIASGSTIKQFWNSIHPYVLDGFPKFNFVRSSPPTPDPSLPQLPDLMKVFPFTG